MSVMFAPRDRISLNAEWPGVSMNVTTERLSGASSSAGPTPSGYETEYAPGLECRVWVSVNVAVGVGVVVGVVRQTDGPPSTRRSTHLCAA